VGGLRVSEPPESSEDSDPEGAALPEKLLADFLAKSPPQAPIVVVDMVNEQHSVGGGRASRHLANPDVLLHCSSDTCNGERMFMYTNQLTTLSHEDWERRIVRYLCRNCRTSEKWFALLLLPDANGSRGIAIKLGEYPPFGPPVPPRVITLIGPDRELFLRGRRAENAGLGIGAFAYYRRVVENQKNRLIDEILKVAKRVEAPQATIQTLELARAENQFSKAVELVRDAIPESLRIEGHNPLTLLHRALSEGLHEHDEAECLTRAQAIREVLTELAERIGQALKDHATLRESLTKLFSPVKSRGPDGTKS
jgi:hypothetical protein